MRKAVGRKRMWPLGDGAEHGFLGAFRRKERGALLLGEFRSRLKDLRRDLPAPPHRWGQESSAPLTGAFQQVPLEAVDVADADACRPSLCGDLRCRQAQVEGDDPRGPRDVERQSGEAVVRVVQLQGQDGGRHRKALLVVPGLYLEHEEATLDPEPGGERGVRQGFWPDDARLLARHGRPALAERLGFEAPAALRSGSLHRGVEDVLDVDRGQAQGLARFGENGEAHAAAHLVVELGGLRQALVQVPEALEPLLLVHATGSTGGSVVRSRVDHLLAVLYEERWT